MLAVCFASDSLCASVFVGVSIWTKCLWLGGLRALVDFLLFFIDVYLQTEMLYRGGVCCSKVEELHEAYGTVVTMSILFLWL